MAKQVKIPFGRVAEYKPAHPERTAYRSHGGTDFDLTFREWPSRGAMLKTIEMQSKREPRFDDWKDYYTSRWHVR